MIAPLGFEEICLLANQLDVSYLLPSTDDEYPDFENELAVEVGEELLKVLKCEAIKALQAELNTHRWIPVTEELPKMEFAGKDASQSEWVRITDGENVIDAYYYDYTKREAKPNYATGKGWYCHGIRKSDITHFQYITLPESEAEDE